jgi:hypothetical protein
MPAKSSNASAVLAELFAVVDKSFTSTELGSSDTVEGFLSLLPGNISLDENIPVALLDIVPVLKSYNPPLYNPCRFASIPLPGAAISW